jgi:hypothetical protein
MKNLAFTCAVLALISACGGGGGGGSSATAASTATPAAPATQTTPTTPTTPSTPTTPTTPTTPETPAQGNKLAAYVGTWNSDCNFHEIDNVTITSPSNDTLTITTRTDYYAGVDCTGAILATETEGASLTARYVDTIDSSAVLTQGAAATALKVDRVYASTPQRTRSIVGTAVTHVVLNNQPQWCIDYGNGTQTCVRDDGTYPAQSGIAGGLSLQGNTFYELIPNGSLYVANGIYTKK